MAPLDANHGPITLRLVARFHRSAFVSCHQGAPSHQPPLIHRTVIGATPVAPMTRCPDVLSLHLCLPLLTAAPRAEAGAGSADRLFVATVEGIVLVVAGTVAKAIVVLDAGVEGGPALGTGAAPDTGEPRGQVLGPGLLI